MAPMTRGPALVLAACAVLVFLLLVGGVGASSTDPGRRDCGAALAVVLRGGGYQGGGEPLTDQDRFDRRCVDRATTRVGLAAVPVVVGLVVLVRGRGRRKLGPHPSDMS
ncbi:MAG: hypothetical protein ACJ72D_15885 [Marmoricola sp.]